MYYGQFREDQKLHQLLGDKTEGFYIDVGAWEPEHDSVTKHFYDKGWRGINVEPVRYYYDKLVEARPRDVNLNVAVADTIGEQTISFEIGKGLASFVPEYGDHLNDRQAVHVTTLKAICDVFVSGPIDFLKIDVEGFERQVILGADFTRYRPTILCLEAVAPHTLAPKWDEWEQLLFERGYDFFEMDTVNRWYRAR